MRCDRGTESQTGFTLVELLVVLAVAGLVTALLASGFRVANAAWHRLATRDSDRREVAATRDLLRSLLTQAYPAVTHGDASRRAVLFEGGPDRMVFLAPLLQRFGAADIVFYSLRIADDRTLWLGWRMDRTVEAGFPRERWEEERLTAHLTGSAIAYFGADNQQGSPHWQNTWQGQASLPLLVRIPIPAGISAEEPGQDLVVAPMLTVPACVQDAASPCED